MFRPDRGPATALRQRWAILAAAGIYGEIARIVTRRAAAWDRRAVVDKTQALVDCPLGVQAFLPAMPGLYHRARLRRYSRRDFTA
jgi:phytoene synthase